MDLDTTTRIAKHGSALIIDEIIEKIRLEIRNEIILMQKKAQREKKPKSQTQGKIGSYITKKNSL